MTALCVILGDQLTLNNPALLKIDKKKDRVFMCEVFEEATYVKHHKLKIAFLFSAMRHFSQELEAKNYQLSYTMLEDKKKINSITLALKEVINHYNIDTITIMHPGEYRVLQDIKKWPEKLGVKLEVFNNTNFLCEVDEFKNYASDKKTLRMEYFYRYMRKKHNILMKNNKPEGEQWNFDKDNRKPPAKNLTIPEPYYQQPDAISQKVLELVQKNFETHFGDLNHFYFAVTRKQALQALQEFIDKRLEHFGDYQDAMLENEPWMYHSHLSFYLNCSLLNPLECIQAAVLAWEDNKAPINAVEGFIRQILGWREFIRGIYWLHSPEYANQNYLMAKKSLPQWFWTGDTQMNCLQQAIMQTKQYAYAHHIQRLMILGNFLLLAGIDPVAVNEWYLIVYADAYEWVEMPNVIGMILYADGGLFASKPYAASGAYINKMSNYCKNCHFNVKEKTGESACPFNYLYWDFLIRNRKPLEANPRMAMIYQILNKMEDTKITAIKKDAKRFLTALQ